MRTIAEELSRQLAIDPNNPVVTLDRFWCTHVWAQDDYAVGPPRCIGLILLAALREMHPLLRVKEPTDGTNATLLVDIVLQYADRVRAWCVDIMCPDSNNSADHIDKYLTNLSRGLGGHCGSVVPQHDAAVWPGERIVRSLYQGGGVSKPAKPGLTSLVMHVLEYEGIDISGPLRLDIKTPIDIDAESLSLLMEINWIVQRWSLPILDLKPTPIIYRDVEWLRGFYDRAVRVETIRIGRSLMRTIGVSEDLPADHLFALGAAYIDSGKNKNACPDIRPVIITGE